MPKAVRTLPPADYLHQCFEYDPASGELRWRRRPREHFSSPRGFNTWNARFSGQKAGRQIPGRPYLIVCLDYRDWHTARIIYKMFHLVEPEYIDHKDREPRNNKIENLRSATKQENGRNSFHPVGASGFTGVRPKRKRFVANIQGPSGKNIFLGSFVTAEEAHAVYREASIRIFGEFSPFHDAHPNTDDPPTTQA